MSKVNEFFESHTGAFNGYKKLAVAMVATESHSSVLETNIEVRGIDEGTFNVRCFDGVALAVNDKMNVVLEYPTKKELTHEQLQACLKYRGLEEKISVFAILTFAKTTFGDIMMLMGKPTMIHHKK